MSEHQVLEASERKYLLKGLVCAGCAAKIEDALNKTEGIDEANLDLSTGVLYVKSRLSNEHEVVENIVK
ncbi:MAG: Heavy metal translocating P-type ATPase, partial [Thermovirga lienii]